MVIDSDDEEEIETQRKRPTKKARHHSLVNDTNESDFDCASIAISESSSSSSGSPSSSSSSSPSSEPEQQSLPLALKRYPETYQALQDFQDRLGGPLPDTDDFDEAAEAVEAIMSRLRSRYSAHKTRANKSKIVKLVLPPGTIDKNACFDPDKVGFMDLPGEIRNQIYSLALKTEEPIDFRLLHGFPHHAAFLRVNKTVYSEARQVLYSQNRFLFDQNCRKIGKYSDPIWREANYIFVRKFLTDIGPFNTSLMTNIGLTFVDSSLGAQPGLSRSERYFENNKDLYWILKYLGRHGKIEKLTLAFDGRAVFSFTINQAAFLHALGGVKTDYLAFGNGHTIKETDYHRSFASKDTHGYATFRSGLKLDLELMKALYGVMVRPKLLKELGPDFKF